MTKKRDPRDPQRSLFSTPSNLVQERELSAEVCRAHNLASHALAHAYDTTADEDSQGFCFDNAGNHASEAQQLMRKLRKLRGERID